MQNILILKNFLHQMLYLQMDSRLELFIVQLLPIHLYKILVVEIKLSADYHIPANSAATIETNPLGSPVMDIQLGNSTLFLKSGDTITQC